MRTVEPSRRSAWWLLLCVGAGLASPGGALACKEEAQAAQENGLLHRRLDFTKVRRWDEVRGTWQPVALSGSRVYLVNLWADFCAPCLEEFPLLRQLVAAWRDRSEVEFLFVSATPSAATTRAYWRSHADRVPQVAPLLDLNDGLRTLLDCDKLPLTLLVDGQGMVRQAFIGSIKGRQIEVASAVDRLATHLLGEGQGQHRPGRGASTAGRPPGRPTAPAGTR